MDTKKSMACNVIVLAIVFAIDGPKVDAVLINLQLNGTVIGFSSTTLEVCSYLCKIKYVVGCVAYNFNYNTSICQFLSDFSEPVSVVGGMKISNKFEKLV